jgi:RHS repeat-associated protein
VNAGNTRTEFAYDGESRLSAIRQLTNGTEVSFRRFVWCDNICEERDASGAVTTKRFWDQGVKIETGANAGSYFYTRDHLGSVCELTDITGVVRARYAYDPFGHRSRTGGSIEADFSFAGLLFAPEARLLLARFRTYDPDLGRWLSRDPLNKAEEDQGPNLYAYVGNNPVNRIDPLGLRAACCEAEKAEMEAASWEIVRTCTEGAYVAASRCSFARHNLSAQLARSLCEKEVRRARKDCSRSSVYARATQGTYYDCIIHSECDPGRCPNPAVEAILGAFGGSAGGRDLAAAGAAAGRGVSGLVGSPGVATGSGLPRPPPICAGVGPYQQCYQP